MKRHLNTLFITTQGSYLSKDGECVSIQIDGRPAGKVPIHTIGGIVCFGNVLCSPFLLGHCAENGVLVSFFTEYGRYLAAVHGPVSGNVLLRRAQYRRADDVEACAETARTFVIGKIANCRTVLRRAERTRRESSPATDSTDDTRLSKAAEALGACLEQVRSPLSLDSVRGVEGQAAALYFGAFDAMISTEKDAFRFRGRNRRPPLDPVNCLLSFLYTLLMHDIRSALEGVGLDPAVGFLHRDRPGRPSLALDMMEEFRPSVADRLALTLINRGQVNAKNFSARESGAVVMDETARKTVLTAWQERKQEEVRHPFLDETMTVGLLWHMQARLLARVLRGDSDTYPPFTTR